MATAVIPSKKSLRNIDDRSLETFSLIWLDANANVTVNRNRDTEQQLRSIINQLKKFENIEECLEYIEQRSLNERLVLIVSGQLGRKIVPNIHKLRQIISIYVFCMDKKTNEEWASKFPKVKAVVVELDELVSRISADHKIQKKIEEPLSINIFTANSSGGTSTKEVNGEFVFSQVLIDCLLRLKSTQIDKNELIDCCKNQYQENYIELDNLDKFEKDYSSNEVLWWYTRESFFYKTLNAALRTQNIHMIFLFRAFIGDIHCELQKYQSQKPLQVYRSQMMSNDELKTLQNCIGQFISINSFFSTSINRKKALSFLKNSYNRDDLERILFEIDADPTIVTTKSFANISKYSAFPKELEVLFMIGSIFLVESINLNSDQIWIIRMTLCSEDEHKLKQVLIYMKQQNGSGDTNLRTLGKVLWKMGKLNMAEEYYKRLLKQVSSNDPLIESLYEDLGELASQRGKITSSLININTKWKQDGITIAGGNGQGNGQGNELNQLYYPYGIYVDDKNQTIYIADCSNHRIVEWKSNAKNGQVKQMNQLNSPRDVTVDEKNNSLIICDMGNRRVVRWSRQDYTNGETIISNIDCRGLNMDNSGNLYVSDCKKNTVRRWKIGDKDGIVVAGGNGKGINLNQLNWPTYLFVDEDHSVYVSDCDNHRVMKWIEGAKEGIIVAGGQGKGNSLSQLSYPQGVFVDQWENIYVCDSCNDRIMRWSKGSKEGSIIIGGNGKWSQPNQLDGPEGLSFDQQGNIYVVDWRNNRVQKFLVEKNGVWSKIINHMN